MEHTIILSLMVNTIILDGKNYPFLFPVKMFEQQSRGRRSFHAGSKSKTIMFFWSQNDYQKIHLESLIQVHHCSIFDAYIKLHPWFLMAANAILVQPWGPK